MASMPALERLLRYIAPERRCDAIRDTIESGLYSTGDQLAHSVALLSFGADRQTTEDVRTHLLKLIEDGHADDVFRACQSNTALLWDVWNHCVKGLVRGADGSTQAQGSSNAGARDDHVQIVQGSDRARTEELVAYLRFVGLASVVTKEKVDSVIITAVLKLLSAREQPICATARDTLLALIASSPFFQQEEAEPIWPYLRFLLSNAATSFHRDIAFSIWTRLAVTNPRILVGWLNLEYWQLLQDGLRYGDGERRKQCLAILRQSVLLTANDQTLASMVTSSEKFNTEQVVEQYERFCTVFETILLGRYLNQVMACEADLDALASPTSLVKPEWLYVLLSAALSPKIQDSNRKFIGNWIMRRNFQPDQSEAFATFFGDAFLAWATSGSLHTATLKKMDGSMRCLHGERMSQYIESMLLRNSTHASNIEGLVDHLIDRLSTRRSGNFAYASVYMLEGLCRAHQECQQLRLSTSQLTKLAALTTNTALPEVARDFICVRCLKLCADASSRNLAHKKDFALAEATKRWSEIIVRVERRLPANDTTEIGPIASWHAQLSRRAILEQETLERLQSLQTIVISERLLDPELLMNRINSLWNDLDYLDLPKALLVKLPDLLLSKQVLQAMKGSSELAETVRKSIEKLQALSAHRAYLLSPVVLAVRRAVFSDVHAEHLLRLDCFVKKYIQELPRATVDLQFEEATSRLLQRISPAFASFGYEHYFMYHESVGVAALLDILRRLGVQKVAIAKSVFEEVLKRWKKQKSPPPTVSPWKSALQLQAMLLCCENMLGSPTSHEAFIDDASLRALLTDLHGLLSIEPLPSYRYLLSWMILRIYYRKPHLQVDILDELHTTDHHSNPKYLAAMLKMGVALATQKDYDRSFATRLANRLIPLAASSKIVIRHEAQWQVPLLVGFMQRENLNPGDALLELDRYIRSLDKFDQPPLERQYDRFDLDADHTVANLIEGGWLALEGTETSSSCHLSDFFNLEELDAKTGIHPPVPCMSLGEARNKTATTSETQAQGPTEPSLNPVLTPSKAGEPRALQTKGTAYLANGLEEDRSIERNSIIVIASLVDNPYNLGGLSRVSEIFGAAELHIQNQNVTSNKDFTNVSVSSHLHLPILQLSASAIPEYLREKRNEGWTIAGIEQTDRSVLLGTASCKLPKKIVLVIGSEKEGIPALVLGECDILIEIPQQGVTRSLNVQTAASIVLYEYARQHRLPPGMA